MLGPNEMGLQILTRRKATVERSGTVDFTYPILTAIACNMLHPLLCWESSTHPLVLDRTRNRLKAV